MAMQDVAVNFYLIGRALRLKSGDVKIIKNECFGDCRSGLEQVILLWLHQNYNVKRFGVPSWRKVVEVVNKSTGGNNHALAKRIAAKHQGGYRIAGYFRGFYFLQISPETRSRGNLDLAS